MWKTLRPQLVTLLQSIKDTDNQNVFVEVSPAPKIVFDGYPSAYVLPSDNTGDFETTSENERVYAFIVRVWEETKNQGINQAVTAMEGVIDSVIDAVDQEGLKDSTTRTIGIHVPAKYTFLNVLASPGRWQDFPDEELLMAEITVRVQVSVDITS